MPDQSHKVSVAGTLGGRAGKLFIIHDGVVGFYELLNGGSPSSNKIILFYLRVR